jgi:prepilin signal peptidase PulO-like enzyme (type II secretory pathway)
MNGHIALSIFHILVVAPFFLYVAFVRGQLEPWVFTVLQGLGLLLLIYHSYKTIIKWKAHSMTTWINIFHVIAVAPILLYIGSMGYDTPRWAFEILAMLGFSALGYHIYSMVLEIQRMYTNDNKANYVKRYDETKFQE